MDAENILGGGVRLGQGEGSEEAVAILASMFKAQAGDLTGGGVDLMVVVTVELIPQDRADLIQGSQLFESAGTDNAILQPTVRAFDFAFGLG